MPRYYIATALQQMLRYRAQSLLVIVGVAIGVANIILLMSMTDMGRRQTLGQLEKVGARLLIITPHVDFSAGPFAMFSQANSSGHLPMAAYEALQNSPHLSHAQSGGQADVSAMLTLLGHVTSPQKSWSTTIAGATAQVQRFGGFDLANGRWISETDEARHRRVVILGRTAAIELFGEGAAEGDDGDGKYIERAARHTADAIALAMRGRKTVSIRGEDFEVVGILKHHDSSGFEENDSRVFIPLSTAQELFGFKGIQGILARYDQSLSEAEAMKLVKADIAKGLPQGDDVEETVSIFTVHEATKLMDRTLGIFRTVLLGVASIALIVAGIGIMNVMLIRVLRRRTEIGLRRACGAPLNSIVRQFIIESAVQALIGAAVGLIVGGVGIYVFAHYANWEFYISPRTVAIAIGFGALVGVAFGVYPAYTAAKVDPIKSLRFEQ
jgi:ABC-type antimicrobial peptide transport system permease subunit